MNVPESWLRSFCNPPLSGPELAHKLLGSMARRLRDADSKAYGL